jgi:hypothetical protein
LVALVLPLVPWQQAKAHMTFSERQLLLNAQALRRPLGSLHNALLPLSRRDPPEFREPRDKALCASPALLPVAACQLPWDQQTLAEWPRGRLV